MIFTFNSYSSLSHKAKQRLRFNLLIATLFFFIFRTAIPAFKYPFLPLFIGFLIFLGFQPRKRLWNQLIRFCRDLDVALLLVLILVFWFFFSNKFYLLIFKDIINVLVILTLLYIMRLVLDSSKNLKIFIKDSYVQIICFSLIIATSLLFFRSNEVIDTNFSLIPVFAAFVLCLKSLSVRLNRFTVIAVNMILILYTFSVLSSSSRRGIIILLVLITYLFIAQVFRFSKRHKKISLLAQQTSLFFSLIFFTMLSMGIFLSTSFQIKNNLLLKTGVSDLLQAKQNITQKIYKYVLLFNNDISQRELMDIIWSHKFDPADPNSGWASRTHKIMFPLYGENVKIVPAKTKGYLMDSTCEASIWNNNAYSFTEYGSASLKENQGFNAHVYCYVDEKFNGDFVRIKSEGSNYHTKSDYYDLSRKGTWQKLNIKSCCGTGSVSFLLYFGKANDDSFKNLNGFVVFAHPDFQVFNKDSRKDSLNIRRKSRPGSSSNKEQSKVSNDFNCYESSFYGSTNFLLILEKTESEFIRRIAEKFINEDSTYNPMNSDLIETFEPRNILQRRTHRWLFAWHIFRTEYSWKQKIFGNGFAYLNWYGKYFYQDKSKSDYPHNPFLSILLYSGLLGLLVYCLFIYKILKRYLCRPDLKLYFLFFLITYFFTFFSSNGPFTPPVSAFFVLFPFIIDGFSKVTKEPLKSNRND